MLCRSTDGRTSWIPDARDMSDAPRANWRPRLSYHHTGLRPFRHSAIFGERCLIFFFYRNREHGVTVFAAVEEEPLASAQFNRAVRGSFVQRRLLHVKSTTSPTTPSRQSQLNVIPPANHRSSPSLPADSFKTKDHYLRPPNTNVKQLAWRFYFTIFCPIPYFFRRLAQ
ncbi:hypothetical protein RRG08_014230 [Elysia crispata]|uniref:Uncharacterized protein n=1 Tax=Elysia crispata TaxID=231223 RepID=A0AAE0XEC0_9GAST|nr:hypothetical protein RRG08_014230 [Elysia crispata]